MSSHPAASVATGCLIFANYAFSEWWWFYFCCGRRRRLPHAGTLRVGPKGSWEGLPPDGGLVVPPSWAWQGAGGHGGVGAQVPPAQRLSRKGQFLCNLPLWLSNSGRTRGAR